MAGGFRRFRLARKQLESTVITSFYFEPEDGGPLWEMRPGQYLTLRLPLASGSVLRTYSLSALAEGQDHHRISVKREDMGLGSGWLHDHMAEGDVIEIAAPRGSFYLDESSTRPILLLAGGVGQTPLLAMLHRLAETRRRVWYIHATQNGQTQAFRDEVERIAAGADGRITLRHVFDAPSAEDCAAGRFDAEGRIDKVFLQNLLPLDDYDVYLCGPTNFMIAMWRLLTELGVPAARIAYEFFGKGGSLAALAESSTALPPVRTAPGNAPKSLAVLAFLTDPDARGIPERALKRGGASQSTIDAGQDATEVVFARSGVTAHWTDAAGSLLELAELSDLNPDFSCRSGICNTCRCAISEGSVTYTEEPLDPPEAGQVLICCSRPNGRIVLDL